MHHTIALECSINETSLSYVAVKSPELQVISQNVS